MYDRQDIIDIFTELGGRLQNFGQDSLSAPVVEQALAANGWFTRAGILRAVETICANMLGAEALSSWTGLYTSLPAAPDKAKNVGVIMAGNIPLVGFSDLMCVVAAGHRCMYKTSSKDSVLIDHMVSLLLEIAPDIKLEPLGTAAPDAVIATGSNNTNRYFRTLYGDIPAIFRGSRSSLALLHGDETSEELAGLADDIFCYSGLGCRNVSRLFLPRGYDIEKLTKRLARHGAPGAKYLNNYRQRSALLRMEGALFTDGGFFLMCEGDGFPSAISEIIYSHYDREAAARQWIDIHDGEIQCIVGRGTGHPRGTGFGYLQSPSLSDYPDGVDVMKFLSEL